MAEDVPEFNLDLTALAQQRRVRVESRARMIAAAVPDGAAVKLGNVEYWVTTGRGKITAELGADPGLEPETPILVRGTTSLVDLAAAIPVFPEYTAVIDLMPTPGKPRELDKVIELDDECATAELDDVEEAFCDFVEEHGRRGEVRGVDDGDGGLGL